MNVDVTHRTLDELRDGLPHIRRSPSDEGVLEFIARRPAVGEREVLEEATLDLAEGLVGDNWRSRGTPHPEMQLNVMNTRVIALVAGDPSRWALAGDQLYIDLDLGSENLRAGTRLSIGEAIIEVTAEPHTGCVKFRRRFGMDAMRFVNSPEGRALNLRGINAKVVRGGVVRRGDVVRKA